MKKDIRGRNRYPVSCKMRANDPLEVRIGQHIVHPVVQAQLLQLAIQREQRGRIAPREHEVQHVVNGMAQAHRFFRGLAALGFIKITELVYESDRFLDVGAYRFLIKKTRFMVFPKSIRTVRAPTKWH